MITNKKNVSIIMPVLNETWSLTKVSDILIQENLETILEIIIPIHPQKTIAESIESINQLQQKYGSLIKIVEQDLPFIGGAIKKGFEAARGDYYLLFASDLETDPYLVKSMIEKAHNDEADIITASRWIAGGDFGKYNPLKKLLNKLFQTFFSLLYQVKLTDMTYGFRILKAELVNNICWENLRHPIFFEMILKPIKLGYKIIEIPAKWEPRQEGESQIAISDYFIYFKIGIKLRFCNTKSFRKSV